MNTVTFANATFSSSGFSPGTSPFPFGTGANADSPNVIAAVPEPPTWALLGDGGVALVNLAPRCRVPA